MQEYGHVHGTTLELWDTRLGKKVDVNLFMNIRRHFLRRQVTMRKVSLSVANGVWLLNVILSFASLFFVMNDDVLSVRMSHTFVFLSIIVKKKKKNWLSLSLPPQFP